MKAQKEYAKKGTLETLIRLPYIDDDDDGGPVLSGGPEPDPVGFGSLERNAHWLVKNWLNEPSARNKLRKAWSGLKPKIETVLSWREGVVAGPYLALLVYMELWKAGRLDRLRRCANERCGRVFFARTGIQTHCTRKCLKDKIVASYDTEEYREKKKLAARRARRARKALEKGAQARARRRKYGDA
jgi:hypothetical protein